MLITCKSVQTIPENRRNQLSKIVGTVYCIIVFQFGNYCSSSTVHKAIVLVSGGFHVLTIRYYKGSGRGGLSPPPSSVVGNALVVIDDGIESVNVKNRYQGARVSARRANREPEDGIRWKFVHGRVVVVR